MLSYTIFFMLDICFDSLLVSNEVKNVFPTSGVYKNKHIAKKKIWAKRSELADRAFVTLCFSMGQSQRNTTSKPNGAEVQLPPRYSHNGCKFIAKRFCFCVLR